MGLDITDLKLNQYYRSIFNSGLRYLLRNDSTRRRCPGFEADQYESDASFPEPWHSILENTQLPAYFLFTYWELSQDLQYTSQIGSERMKLFDNIIRSLNWPRDIGGW